MNPNQQQYYNFHQHTAGPPQPSWQAPPRKQQGGVSWGDPRLSQGSPSVASPASPFPTYGHSLPPPPPPPPGGFAHGSQHDTAAWGVKYNQNQQYGAAQDLKPPLPPRPPSAQAGPQSGWNSQSYQSAPIPPPRPPEYAIPPQRPSAPASNQYFPHEQYSHRPSSHHYEPSNTQWPQFNQERPSLTAWQQPQDFQDLPVSPIEQSQQNCQAAPAARPPSVQAHGHTPSTSGYTQHQSQYYANSMPQVGPSIQSPADLSQWQQPAAEHQVHNHTSHGNSLTQLHPHAHNRQDSHSYTVTPEQTYATPTQSTPQSYAPSSKIRTPSPQPSSQQSYQYRATTPAQQTAQTGQTHDRLRHESNASASSMSMPARSGTIDSVMNAWNTSTSVAANQAPPPDRALEMTDIETQTDFPPITQTVTKVETKIETREIDPYEDLKNEYRTSLNRYATMLRKEMMSTNEQDKMKVVIDFVNREVKLWSVLFNAEPAELVRSSELADLRKALEKAKEEAASRASMTESRATRTISPARVVTPKPLEINTQSAKQSPQDDFVVVDNDGNDVEYSPGGRPRVPVSVPKQSQYIQHEQILERPARNTPPQIAQLPQPPSPSSNAPMTLDDYAMPEPIVKPDQGGPVLSDQSGASANALHSGKAEAPIPIHFQPARPAYMPFTYAEPSMSGLPLTSPANPVDQAYTKLRQDQATDSGRLLSYEQPNLMITAPDRSHSATPSRARQQQEEAFIGLLRQQSKAIRRPQTAPVSDAPDPLRIGTPFKRRQSLPPLVKSLETLRQSLPSDPAQLTPVHHDGSSIAFLDTQVSSVVDDFTFIHQTVVTWDRDNRQHRAKLDKERAERESESQARIDELFNDNQIGYADIAGLEESFKVEEASRKYQEDQDELESFSKAVFEAVTERLTRELATLETLRIKALDLLDLSSQSASARLRGFIGGQDKSERVRLSDAMSLLLSIYDKIEIRQKKIAEAHFERERRRKRLELSVLYTNGDTAGVKKLERDFDKAQAMQVLSEARKRDERANKLMDSFDRAVVRGLAENQEWLDEMSNKASLLRDLVLGSESNGPQGQDREDLLYGSGGVKQTLDLLNDAVVLVAQDSKELVTLSSHADRILNEADFAMFLAEAAIAEADKQEFDKLYNEKTKEDQKLKDEADGRLNGVQKGPEEIYGYIKDVRDYVGGDKDHQARINTALERAKQRNQSPVNNDPLPVVGSIKEV